MTAITPRSQTEIAQAFFSDIGRGDFSAIDRYMILNVEYIVISTQSPELFQVSLGRTAIRSASV
jgi:hypothetical protein